eukprot:11312038-Alexandrium_andersonii.AAC.1
MFWRRLRVFNTARRPIMHLHHWLKPSPDSPGLSGKLLPLMCGKVDEIAREFSDLLSEDSLKSPDVWGVLSNELGDPSERAEDDHVVASLLVLNVVSMAADFHLRFTRRVSEYPWRRFWLAHAPCSEPSEARRA